MMKSGTLPRMNSADRLELDAILREQLRLRNLAMQLEGRIAELSQRLEKPVPAELPYQPPPLPKAAPAATPVVESASAPYSAPPPVPTPVPAAPAPPPPPPVERAPLPPVLPEKPAPPPIPKPASAPDSIELKLGTYWLARIGIVILLTGFVFLGNYAYHHIVPHLGPWGKLSLLALGGVALSGAGAWLERGREAMRNYARVLLAGGAATFYYTAYAAHFVPQLRVIESPLAGGALLLLLAGGFLWFAERRRSEPLALSAVLLSYYTAAINPIGTFSLFSNLLLTAVAVFFLVRHRWTAISFVSLAATYGSYGFWRVHTLMGGGESGSGSFGLALGFLAGYWLLFTVAVFAARREALPPVQRTAFLTVNNAAFFTYASLLFSVHRPAEFWIFALSYGVLLLVLAACAARRSPDEPALDGSYLAQGLALLALGCAAKLTGPQLATVFAVESAVLLTLSRARHRWLYEIAAGLTALAAFVLALEAIQKPALTLSLGSTVTLILLFDAWWLKHLRGELATFQRSGRALGFAVLGLLLAGAVIWKSTPPIWQPTALALAALACALSLRAVRLPEIALPGQVFLYVAGGTFLLRQFGIAPEPAWSPLPLLAIALALTHWWQHQRTLPLSAEPAATLQLASAATAIATAACWLHALHRGDMWLIVTASAAFATLLYGAATRAWAVALVGQVFTVLSIHAFLGGVFFSVFAGSHAALAPIANLAATALLVSRVAGARFAAPASAFGFAQLAFIYRLAAALLLTAWGFAFVESAWLTVFFAVLSAAHIFGGSLLRDRERSITGVAFAAIAFAIFWTPVGTSIAWRDLLAILALPASLRLGHRFAGATALPLTVRNTLVAAALASVWLWVTRYVTAHHTSSGLTVAWALLALTVFIAGLVLRERIYRVGGFAILALAIGRIFIIDVWQLETLYRILSFLVLGAVLLLLGYLYNRFADSIRRWL